VYRQAAWDEPLIFKLGSRGRAGHSLPEAEEEVRRAVGSVEKLLPEGVRRKQRLNLPELSEVEVTRHFVRLSQMNYGIDSGLYPLGSCTMKYNPRINEDLASLPTLKMVHPFQDESTVQGVLKMLYELERWLSEITGTFEVCLHPAAGAQGEFLGTLLMHACLKQNGECEKKTEVIVPDSAHGTNPASAAMAGFNVVVVPSSDDGCIDLEALKAVASEKTAGLMLTNPNTLGLFEKDIEEIARIIHEAGGLLYYDGANLNPLLGRARPGDMGFDIVHINIHKTFSTPHGGGGPGAGPVGVTKLLVEYLPVPTVEYDGREYLLNYNLPKSIGKVRAYHGSIAVILRAYVYILLHGKDGLQTVSEIAVLNSNYLAAKLSRIRGFELPYGDTIPRKHEFVLSASKLFIETGVSAMQVGKRLLDMGIHPPTIYFPTIVEEAMLIEPTETVSKLELDAVVSAFQKISDECYAKSANLVTSPHSTTVTRIDEAKASRPKTMQLTWRRTNGEMP